ncbi:HSFY1 protein, partial [Neodrepanis coruscans]|nr:HSFY1 protein [Neodrepanis coruscans]
LSFLKKLREITHRDVFHSIWWVSDECFVAISEEMFKEKVLLRRGLVRAFEMESMKSCPHQLDLRGLCELPEVSSLCNFRDEFPAEKEAASAPTRYISSSAHELLGHTDILYYYNPCFNRAHPQLLEMCIRRAALKRRTPGAAELDERPLQKPRGS